MELLRQSIQGRKKTMDNLSTQVSSGQLTDEKFKKEILEELKLLYDFMDNFAVILSNINDSYHTTMGALMTLSEIRNNTELMNKIKKTMSEPNV